GKRADEGVGRRVLGGRGSVVAFAVVDCHLADALALAKQNAADGRKDDADDEEGRQYCLGREDWLPGLEPLLLKGRVWTNGWIVVWHAHLAVGKGEKGQGAQRMGCA